MIVRSHELLATASAGGLVGEADRDSSGVLGE